MDGLTEGRIVHYVPEASFNQHRAAVVTHVWDSERGVVNLYIFPDGSFEMTNLKPTSVLYDELGKGLNTWHWIEKA